VSAPTRPPFLLPPGLPSGAAVERRAEEALVVFDELLHVRLASPPSR
jgi:hypothetical protein